MSEDVAAQITAQSHEDLTPIVRQILGEDATPSDDLIATKFGRSAGTATAGIFRVAGSAQTKSAERPWSAVVKALGVAEFQRTGVEDDPYRELEVYRSGVFTDLCGGVRTPYCYAIQSLENLDLLWLEDLSTAPQPPWTDDQFIAAARHFGQFNAHWPAQALPDWPWLTQHGFRAGFTGKPRTQQLFDRLPDKRDVPLIQSFAPDGELDILLQLRDQCDVLLRRAEEMPRGICHLDCHPKNLFPMQEVDGKTYTIGVDWTVVGIANLGIDIGHMLGSPMAWLEVTCHEARTLRDPMFDAYLAGLHDAGWVGDPDEVRLVYLTRLACEAIRNTNLISTSVENPEWGEFLGKLVQHPIDEMAARYSENRAFYVECKEEAIKLDQRI